MMSLWLLVLLFLACGVVVYVYQRLQGVADRLKDLHEDLARNDEQLRRHLTRLQATEEAARVEELEQSDPPQGVTSNEAEDTEHVQ